MSKSSVLSWVCRLIVAVILFQTLFFKFSGAEESKYIFSTVLSPALEGVGRIGSGIVELIAAVFLLLPRSVWFGASLALGTVSGAIFSHLTVLGIEVKGDGGLLFALAITVFVFSAVVLILHRRDIPIVGQVFRASNA
jgi:hypothetical protein